MPDDVPVAVSVVVPHYNDLDNLRLCLAALAAQSMDPRRYEIIVADNNSTCDRAALEALCAPGNVRLVDAPRQGAAEARNAGVAEARGACLAFIDSDCRPERGWLAAGVEALRTSPLVGGRVVVGTETAAVTPVEAFERIFAFNNERYLREERFSVTANMFTTRAVFEAVGGFRNGVSEDVDWGQRAAAAGHVWFYAPGACLEHPARRTWPELTRKWKRLVREGFTLHRERKRSRVAWVVRNWVVLLSIPVALAKAIGSREVPALADRLKAASVMVRLRLWRFAEAHRVAFAHPGGGSR